MILTRLKLDTKLRKTMQALNNPNIFHGAIEQARKGPRTRLLWRLDSINNQKYLLILSSEPLETANLEKQFGYPNDKAESKSYDAFLNSIQNGSLWNFRLVANPCYSIPRDGERGKLMAHVTIPQQTEWLRKKEVPCGFELDHNYRVTNSGWISFKKKDGGPNVTIRTAAYEGVLKVTDKELFKKTLIDGIGRGRAYGLGLLTVVPFRK